MPSKGTPPRTYRADDDVYLPAKEEAERRGEHLTDAIRRFLVAYAKGGDVQEPPA